jgi:hypothetical protein
MGRHEGNHRAEGGHGLSDIDAVNEKLLARGEPPGVMGPEAAGTRAARLPSLDSTDLASGDLGWTA